MTAPERLPDVDPVLVEVHDAIFRAGANVHVATATIPAIGSAVVFRTNLQALAAMPDHARVTIVLRADGGHYEICAWWVEHPEEET